MRLAVNANAKRTMVVIAKGVGSRTSEDAAPPSRRTCHVCRENRMLRLLTALLAGLILSGCAANASFETQPPARVLPADIGPILVLVDRLPSKAEFAADRARQVAIGMSHFSSHTSWDYVDTSPIEKVKQAFAVVYLGINGTSRLAPSALARLRAARRLIVSEYHLRDIRNSGTAFEDIAGGYPVRMPDGTTVAYRGHAFPVTFFEFLAFRIQSPARVVAEYVLPDRSRSPFIIVDKGAMFVNGPLSFMVGNNLHGDMLTACDAIAMFLGIAPNTAPIAMLRLEDVSSIASAWQLWTVVYYLWQAHVPYGIGVIPDLQTRDGYGGALRDNWALVFVLRWAQAHGATIILHGLHHCCSSADAEGYEFWDADRNAPIGHDSAKWMRATIAQGLDDETSLGLRPTIWETPHYSASPTDYGVVSEFFSTAWELRRPIGWLPWALRRDQYGATILPENLGDISNDRTHTVVDQLARAQEMLACRYCTAVGFIHPATIPVGDVNAYVQGLRTLGYTFADPAQVTKPNFR